MFNRLINILFALFLFLMISLPLYASPYVWSVYDVENGLSKTNLKSLSADPGGYLWLGSHNADNGSSGGVTIFSGTHEIVSYGVGEGLSSSAVNDIAFEPVEDEQVLNTDIGAVWIATGKGITVLDRKGSFTRITPGNSPLPGKNVNAIIIDKENTKWISAWGNGITCVDSEFTWAKYLRAPGGLCSNKILNITEGRDGNIWFGSIDNGVSRLDRDGNWLHLSKINSGLIGNCVREIKIEESGRIWFVTKEGVSVYDGQSWMSYTSRNSSLGSFIPTTMVIDLEGNKWIATENGGVFKLDSFGMWTRFHTGNSSLIDNRINDLLVDDAGTVWIATSSGLCSVARSFGSGKRKRAGLKRGFSFVSGRGSYLPFESALVWKRAAGHVSDLNLSLSLPAFFSGGERWFYAAFWADNGFDFNDFEYEISGSRKNDFKITFNGSFEEAKFLVSGGVFSSQNNMTLDKRLKYPFPEVYPDELKSFLLPGKFIPSNDPKIKNLLRTIVSKDAENDMYKTVNDIIYSKFMQHLVSDSQTVKNSEENSGQAVHTVKSVYDVLKEGSGDQHSKSRLVCSLLRAAKVPSRMIMSMGGHVWVEAWISGAGWIPVEASYPVFDYLRDQRTSVPKVFSADEQALASVSGRDDELSRISWNLGLDAKYQKVVSSEFKKHNSISSARLLLLKIVSDDRIPENARLQIDENIYLAAVQREGKTSLVFQDSSSMELAKNVLNFNGLPLVVQIGNSFFWKLIVRRIGDILFIENLECTAVEKGMEKSVDSSF
jgi:streptogramin lyase